MMAETIDTTSAIRIDGQLEPERYGLKALGGNRYEIVDTRSGQPVGTVRHSENSPNAVELFNGKGGFMVTVSTPAGLRYFGLPGSSIAVGDTEVNLTGKPITGKPGKPAAVRKTVTPQQHGIQATILGAGLATRFERVSGNSTHCSKPGVPLAGETTVIEAIANTLARHNFGNLIVNTYFKPASVKRSLARSDADSVRYIDEAEPSGTAGGLRKMLSDPQYAGLLDESKPLLVVQGDAVTDADFSALMNAHVARGALVTIGAQIVDEEDVDKFGIIVTDQSGEDGQSGRITGFQEKPKREEAKSRLGNTGFYIFSPKAYPIIREIYGDMLAKAQTEERNQGKAEPAEVPIDFANDIFPGILRRTQADPSLGAFWAQDVPGYWSDIGNPRQYLESLHDVYEGKVDMPLPENPDRYYRNGVFYWPGAQEKADAEGARLQGNVLVAQPFEE